MFMLRPRNASRAALAARGSTLEEEGQEVEDHTRSRAPHKRDRGAKRSAAATPPEERGWSGRASPPAPPAGKQGGSRPHHAAAAQLAKE